MSRLKCLILLALMFADRVESQETVFQDLYTPPQFENVSGNQAVDIRKTGTYQQLFNASLFASVPAGGGWIRTLDFRVVPHTPIRGSFGRIDGISIELSTTSRGASSLSTVFAENLGSDNLVYYSANRVTEFIALTSSEGPSGYNPSFAGDGKGFFYDPTKGNLLMTIRGFQLPTTVSSAFYLDSILASPLQAGVVSPGLHDLSGSLSSKTLITHFTVFSIIPEPAFGAVAILGIATLYLTRRLNKVQSKESNLTV